MVYWGFSYRASIRYSLMKLITRAPSAESIVRFKIRLGYCYALFLEALISGTRSLGAYGSDVLVIVQVSKNCFALTSYTHTETGRC